MGGYLACLPLPQWAAYVYTYLPVLCLTGKPFRGRPWQYVGTPSVRATLSSCHWPTCMCCAVNIRTRYGSNSTKMMQLPLTFQHCVLLLSVGLQTTPLSLHRPGLMLIWTLLLTPPQPVHCIQPGNIPSATAPAWTGVNPRHATPRHATVLASVHPCTCSPRHRAAAVYRSAYYWLVAGRRQGLNTASLNAVHR